MDFFEITGGKKLSGTIDVCGSKNAATPILAATLLTREECVLENLPLVEDVFTMVEILRSMGAKARWTGERTLSVRAENIDPAVARDDLVKKLRSSILLLGALAARFEKFSLHRPGGCVIGARPVGTHFDALAKMGVDISADEKRYRVDASRRRAAKVVLREFSVTATENAMMLAATLPEKTTIKIAAAEPHTENLGMFLVAMGAKISGLGTHTLEIEGTKHLRGTHHTIIPDANEAATFLILGAATGSSITVRGAREDHLDIVLEKLREFGAEIVVSNEDISVSTPCPLTGVGKLDARVYPGIPTDIQAPLAVLATQARGETIIHDTLFEGRFNYIGELQKMGANAHILNPHQALVSGPTPLRAATIFSYDLRAGAALIIAALAAHGTTIIKDIHQVDRGYEKIEERLRELGAEIERKKVKSRKYEV